jgi:hypothetical protein
MGAGLFAELPMFVETGAGTPLARALSARDSPIERSTAPRIAAAAITSKPPIINKFTRISFICKDDMRLQCLYVASEDEW